MRVRNIALLGVLLLTACAVPQIQKPVASNEGDAELRLTPTSYASLPAWGSDDFNDFALAYDKSCKAVLKRDSQNYFHKNKIFGKNQEWQIACRKFADIDKNNARVMREFFERNFTPYIVSADAETTGLFTGYYEASLKGSRTKQGSYQTPLRARPDDLVMVQLGDFRDELKGQRIAGRVISGRLKPYETHAQIRAGQLPDDQDQALVYVDDPVDAFFLQIQGSGVVQLDDGSQMRVGYAGQNGHPYYAVGRALVDRGALTKDEVSMQSIRQWMADNPDQAVDLMTLNKSYVFFRELATNGPVGGSGVELTPERSLAIDHSIIAYGMPVWVDVMAPDQQSASKARLMVTQDTGGAIRGPVRGDYFWGYGDRAELMAGIMKSQGRYWFLMPKTL